MYAEPPPIPDDDEEPGQPPEWHPAMAVDARSAYSQLCQQFVHMMIQLGQQRVMRPISSKVLAEWERRLTPTLEGELRRKPFNILEIREWIKSVLRSHNGEMTFAAMSSGLRPHEVSRVFVSVLMLADTQEVLLVHAGSRGGEDDFIVKLQGDRERPVEDSDD
jgi:hypothetical protein